MDFPSYYRIPNQRDLISISGWWMRDIHDARLIDSVSAFTVDSGKRSMENNENNMCEYAENALEHYMKENLRLSMENVDLKRQIRQLLWLIEEKD